MMTLDELTLSLASPHPPRDLPALVVALWHDGKGDWLTAHEITQDVTDRAGAHVHAYLHRKEGDLGNALYWYRRAGVHPASGSLDDEWRALVALLLDD